MDTSIKLLIVDDELNIRNGLQLGVEWRNLGISEVMTAKTGAEAYEICKEKQPELILTDIRMPGMDGLELAGRLHYSPLRIIIMSGYADFEYAQKAIKLGIEGYLLKPVKIDELYDLVRKSVAEITALQKSRHILSTEEISGLGVHQLVFGNDSKLNMDSNEFERKMISAFIYTNEHYQEHIGISEIAGHLNMSNNYFSSFFKKRAGMTYTDYLARIRVWHAQDYLKKTNMKIFEISETVGFSDYRYFNTVFSKMTGMPPSLYKKKNTEN